MMIDVFELAEVLTKLDEDKDGAQAIEEKLVEKYGCGIDQFSELINELLPMIFVAKSPLSDQMFKGFGTPTEDGKGTIALCKIKAEIKS